MVLRDGDSLEWIMRYRDLDLMQTAARVADFINRYTPHAVMVDGVGAGGGVVDRLRQMGFGVHDINAGGQALDGQRCANLRAEMWAKMKDWLRDRGDIPAEDGELADDLTGPEYGFDARNRLQLERKRDM